MRPNPTLIFLLVPAFWPAPAPPAAPEPPDTAKLVVWYRLTYRPDTADRSRSRTETMQLLVGSRLSRFESRNAYRKDSLSAAFEPLLASDANGAVGQLYVNAATAVPKANFRYVVVKEPAATVFYDRIHTRPTLYRIDDAAQPSAWRLGTEQRSIAGYACQKAECTFAGRRYEAWFTREIPVSDGPYKFRGLPGLIVALADDRQDYRFEVLRVRKPTQPLPVGHPANIVRTTQQDFDKGLAHYVQNLPQLVASVGSASPAENQETVRVLRAKISAFNNPLERR